MGRDYDPAWYSRGPGERKRPKQYRPCSSTKRLLRVHRRFHGVCQSCGCNTAVPFVMRAAGWKFSEDELILVSPDGLVSMAVASTQHILPRSEGGTSEPSNLTLYCRKCNNEDDELVMRLKKMIADESQPEVSNDRDPGSG